jgi:hypothetical protein
MARPRRGWFAVVAVGLAVQVVVAGAALIEPRPARYGWQMYSGMPVNPPAWSVVDGEQHELRINDLLLHPRAEIDRVALLRNRACELTGADAIRFEPASGPVETVECR